MKDSIAHAPHLPSRIDKPSFRIRLHQLEFLLFLICLSMLAGGVAALGTVAWLAPPIVSNSDVRIVGGVRGTSALSVDVNLMAQTNQRLVTLIDPTKTNQTSYTPLHAIAGRAVLLSSDGWAVTGDISPIDTIDKRWLGRDAQGVVHAIDRVIEDPIHRLVYVKFSGDGFRIIPFSSWDAITGDAVFWSVPFEYSGASIRWREVILASVEKNSTDIVFPIWRPEFLHVIQPGVSGGSILLTDRGELAGLTMENNRLVPGWVVEAGLASILSEGILHYRGLPIDGYVTTQPEHGFYVTRIRRNAVSGIRRGDVILRMSGQPIETTTLSRFMNNDSLEITILRDGKEEVLTEKIISVF